MRNSGLKPYVHKIKGAKYYALYDILNGNFFQVLPEGNAEQLRENLMEAGLIFETDGIIPFKVEPDLYEELNNVQIRELQIKLNGKKEDTCWQRNDISIDYNVMGDDIIESLEKNLMHLHVKKIRIETDHLEPSKIEKILSRFKCRVFDLYARQGIEREILENVRKISQDCNSHLTIHDEIKMPISELKVELFHFFYSQHFNPCFGHQVAIDTGGEIKPCLWSGEVLGNIKSDNLKDMVISGIFDKYWEMTKNKIEVCKDCEKRYACNDCRVAAAAKTGNQYAKPPYCEYDPFNG